MATMNTASGKPLPLDHLVLPAAGLPIARSRMEALGFTVAPDGVHPFGTRNACVYFADGTFLEPLAYGDSDLRSDAEKDGNAFVILDRRFRERLGAEGFSAIVFATDDASSDHVRFCREGISAGNELFFSRPFVDAAGRSDTASFRLAFAAARDAAPFFFACERVNAPAVDRSRLETHENGAERITAVAVSANDPEVTAGLVSRICGASALAREQGRFLELPNARIDIVPANPAEGEPSSGEFAFEGVTFCVRDLGTLRRLLADRGIEYEAGDAWLRVPRTPGQGADFIFEETQ